MLLGSGILPVAPFFLTITQTLTVTLSDMDVKNMEIRQLGRDEEIPYSLLMLADESIEAINRYIFDAEVYVLEEDGKVIAVYALQRLNEAEIEIKNIAVVPDFQGRGIGGLLLRDAAERAKAEGFGAIIIGTGDASTKQLHLYQREGFRIVGVRENFFVDNYPKPIYENGVRLKDMIVLKKELRV